MVRAYEPTVPAKYTPTLKASGSSPFVAEKTSPMAYVSEYEDRGLDKVNVRKTNTIQVNPKLPTQNQNYFKIISKNVLNRQNPIPHNRFRRSGGYTCIVTSDDQMVDKNGTS